MLSVDDLLDEARRTSGCGDYGTLDFVEGLQVLVKSLNDEGRLSPANEIEARKFLVKTLANRLRMQRDLTRHPEILDQELLPPVLITSLPRTGSTKLHRMLAASGEFNALKYWQSFNYAPYEADDRTTPDPRIAEAERHHEWMYRRSPLFFEGHPTWADEVDEELFLLDAGFNCLYNHASFFQVPSYVQWVLGHDARDAFVTLRRILQYAQWQHFRGRRRRFVMKSPAFLGMEAAFADVFRGADFIVTHRHPAQVVASVCALYCGTLGLYNDGDFASFVGPAMMMSFGETIRQHLLWRDGYPAEKVMDVRFDDVVAHEFDLLPKIFGLLNMRFSEAHRGNVEAWLAIDAARRKPARQFTLADYGLDEAAVNERFAGYVTRYAEFL